MVPEISVLPHFCVFFWQRGGGTCHSLRLRFLCHLVLLPSRDFFVPSVGGRGMDIFLKCTGLEYQFSAKTELI